MAGMEITVVEAAGAAPQTVLNGPIRDQAELSGVLQSLYALHLTILDVTAGPMTLDASFAPRDHPKNIPPSKESITPAVSC